jgi:hypothetical protein
MTSLKTYRYLKQEIGRNSNDCLLSCIPPDVIASSVIVRDEVNSTYAAWNPMALYIALVDALILTNPPQPLAYHEVILGHLPQRFRIDLDVPIDDHFRQLPIPSEYLIPQRENKCKRGHSVPFGKWPINTRTALPECCNQQVIANEKNNTPEIMRMRYIYDQIIRAYEETIIINGIKCTFTLCASHGPTKYSFHLISTAYADSSAPIHALAQALQHRLPPLVQQFNDVGVCPNGTHNLRLCLAAKPNSMRVKYIAAASSSCGDMQSTSGPSYISPNIFKPISMSSIASITFDEWVQTLVTKIDIICVLYEIPAEYSYDKNTNLKKYFNSLTNPPLTSEEIANIDAQFPGNIYIDQDSSTGRHIFHRTAPGNCTICQRIHDKDNTLSVYRRSSSIWAYCRRSSVGLKIT